MLTRWFKNKFESTVCRCYPYESDNRNKNVLSILTTKECYKTFITELQKSKIVTYRNQLRTLYVNERTKCGRLKAEEEFDVSRLIKLQTFLTPS